MQPSILLLGGPDSGKTNFVGRVWAALDEGKGSLCAAEQPSDIRFVMEVAEHLQSGSFAPRTEHTEERRDFEVVVVGADGVKTAIVIPDIRGELWRKAVLDGEISSEWMEEMRQAHGAILFVRVDSETDVPALDWVASRKLLRKIGGEPAPDLPTQVMLCELLRFLEVSLADRPDGGNPRVSVVVSAWDLVDGEISSKGPRAYLNKQYPLFGGRLDEIERLDIRVLGLSLVGGDLEHDDACRESIQENGLDGSGWVAIEGPDGQWIKDGDLTLPVAWAVG